MCVVTGYFPPTFTPHPHNSSRSIPQDISPLRHFLPGAIPPGLV